MLEIWALATDCHAEGRGFESHQPLREKPHQQWRFLRSLFADDYVRHDPRPSLTCLFGVDRRTTPTGRHARFSGVNIFRFDGGKVVEIWNHRDDLGLMEQLGASVFAGARPG